MNFLEVRRNAHERGTDGQRTRLHNCVRMSTRRGYTHNRGRISCLASVDAQQRGPSVWERHARSKKYSNISQKGRQSPFASDSEIEGLAIVQSKNSCAELRALVVMPAPLFSCWCPASPPRHYLLYYIPTYSKSSAPGGRAISHLVVRALRDDRQDRPVRSTHGEVCLHLLCASSAGAPLFAVLWHEHQTCAFVWLQRCPCGKAYNN